MNELTMVIDSFGHQELEEYLKSLKGISHVIIKNEEYIEIYLKYNSNLITPKIIKMEILLFLDILKIPSMLAFDKHPKIETNNYIIIRDDFCCEYCFKSSIEDLFEIEGIEKVESNFNGYSLTKADENGKIIINIKYNPNLINAEAIKQIDLNLDI